MDTAEKPNVDLNTGAVITEDTIVQLREMMAAQNPEWTLAKRQWHYRATRDTIRHWAWGIGDDNPLWVDNEYGKTTQWGTNLAPPTFLYSAAAGPKHENSTGARRGGKGGPLAGIHAIWAKEEWEWKRHIVRGMQTFCSEDKTVDVIPHESKFGGMIAEVISENRFFTEDGEHLASKRISFLHFGRKSAADRGKINDITRQVWSDEMLEKLLADLELERVRGATDLRWDDVVVGEDIPHVVKGPLTVSEMITFYQGWGGSYRAASEIAHKYIKKHPKVNVPDRVGRFPDFPGRAHMDPQWARECGFPDAYDVGSQRASWLAHAVTNWMGDNAMLTNYSIKLTGLNIIGDATWVTGRVTGKREVAGERLIDLALTATNQRGKVTAVATATVRPPK